MKTNRLNSKGKHSLAQCGLTTLFLPISISILIVDDTSFVIKNGDGHFIRL